MPRLKAEWHTIAPRIEPERCLEAKNKQLTKNILNVQMRAGTVKKFHSLLMNTNPKCDMCVSANAEASKSDAFFSPTDLAKLA